MRRSMPGHRTVALTLVMELLVILALSGPAHADAVVVSQEVRDEVANTGRARVIVQVQLPSPFVAEGGLPTWAQVLTQRTDIAFAQSRVFSRLQGRGHSVLHQFDTVPYVVLEIEPDALQELETDDVDVRRVVRDARWNPLLAQSG